MKSPQPNKFHSVAECLASLPDAERKIVDILRELALTNIPQVKEKLSYNVPYYYRFRRICFIWPASIPWGKVPMHGVNFGFVNGHLLSDEAGYLELGGRKQVALKTFFDPYEIDGDLLRAYLFEAVDIDKQLSKSRST